MSTPIANIPVPPSAVPTMEEDPEVLAILQEMQQQQAMGSVPPSTVVKQMVVPPSPPMHMQPPMAPPGYGVHVKPSVSKPFFQGEIAQRAVYAALIAYVLFYPKTLEMVYGKFPIFEKVMPYDSILRFLLLAVVLYALMWKFDM